MGLGALVDFFLVECKGWKDAVNSEQVSWFLTKIRHRGVRFGILIAANGITGEPEHLSRANFLVSVEMATFGIQMVIVTREEIEKLTSGEDFARLIIHKVCTSMLPAVVVINRGLWPGSWRSCPFHWPIQRSRPSGSATLEL